MTAWRSWLGGDTHTALGCTHARSGAWLAVRCAAALWLQVRTKLGTLKLSNKAVWDREHGREAAGKGVETPW